MPQEINVPQDIIDKAKILDKHYIPARYPNGFESGAPTDYYTRGEAETAVEIAGEIIEFCKNHLNNKKAILKAVKEYAADLKKAS